jgi:hypothetical protein
MPPPIPAALPTGRVLRPVSTHAPTPRVAAAGTRADLFSAPRPPIVPTVPRPPPQQPQLWRAPPPASDNTDADSDEGDSSSPPSSSLSPSSLLGSGSAVHSAARLVVRHVNLVALLVALVVALGAPAEEAATGLPRPLLPSSSSSGGARTARVAGLLLVASSFLVQGLLLSWHISAGHGKAPRGFAGAEEDEIDVDDGAAGDDEDAARPAPPAGDAVAVPTTTATTAALPTLPRAPISETLATLRDALRAAAVSSSKSLPVVISPHRRMERVLFADCGAGIAVPPPSLPVPSAAAPAPHPPHPLPAQPARLVYIPPYFHKGTGILVPGGWVDASVVAGAVRANTGFHDPLRPPYLVEAAAGCARAATHGGGRCLSLADSAASASAGLACGPLRSVQGAAAGAPPTWFRRLLLPLLLVGPAYAAAGAMHASPIFNTAVRAGTLSLLVCPWASFWELSHLSPGWRRRAAAVSGGDGLVSLLLRLAVFALVAPALLASSLSVAGATSFAAFVDVGVSTGTLLVVTVVPVLLPILSSSLYRSVGITALPFLLGRDWTYPALSALRQILACAALVVLLAADPSRTRALWEADGWAFGGLGQGQGKEEEPDWDRVVSAGEPRPMVPTSSAAGGLAVAAIVALVSAGLVVAVCAPVFRAGCLGRASTLSSSAATASSTSSSAEHDASDAGPAAPAPLPSPVTARRLMLTARDVVDTALLFSGRTLPAGLALAFSLAGGAGDVAGSDREANGAGASLTVPDSAAAPVYAQTLLDARVAIGFAFAVYGIFQHALFFLVDIAVARRAQRQRSMRREEVDGATGPSVDNAAAAAAAAAVAVGGVRRPPTPVPGAARRQNNTKALASANAAWMAAVAMPDGTHPLSASGAGLPSPPVPRRQLHFPSPSPGGGSAAAVGRAAAATTAGPVFVPATTLPTPVSILPTPVAAHAFSGIVRPAAPPLAPAPVPSARRIHLQPEPRAAPSDRGGGIVMAGAVQNEMVAAEGAAQSEQVIHIDVSDSEGEGEGEGAEGDDDGDDGDDEDVEGSGAADAGDAANEEQEWVDADGEPEYGGGGDAPFPSAQSSGLGGSHAGGASFASSLPYPLLMPVPDPTGRAPFILVPVVQHQRSMPGAPATPAGDADGGALSVSALWGAGGPTATAPPQPQPQPPLRRVKAQPGAGGGGTLPASQR